MVAFPSKNLRDRVIERDKSDDVGSHLIGVIGNVIYGLRLRGIDYKQFLFSSGLFRKLVYFSPYILGRNEFCNGLHCKMFLHLKDV